LIKQSESFDRPTSANFKNRFCKLLGIRKRRSRKIPHRPLSSFLFGWLITDCPAFRKPIGSTLQPWVDLSQLSIKIIVLTATIVRP